MRTRGVAPLAAQLPLRAAVARCGRRKAPRSACGQSSSRGQQGIALVLVLWIIALLTIMALGLTTTQRTETALARNQIDAARFRAHAETALALTALNFLSTPLEATEPGVVWTPNGVPRTLVLDGVNVTVTVTNEASRIDLNVATRDVLAALIELAQGEEDFDPSVRDALADAIVDWRDEDDLIQLNGAEDGEYADVGLPYGAGDGPFTSVEELRQVLGMTRALYQRLAPHLTVWNAMGEVEQRFAAPQVLVATQGILLEDAVELVAQRDQPLLPDGRPAAVADRGGPLYRVRVSQTDATGASRHMEALLSVQPGGRPPYEVLWRRYGLLADESAPPAPAADVQ